MKPLTHAALGAAFALIASAAQAQTQTTPPVGPDWSKVVVKTIDLGQRTYMLEGQGGNVTVAIGDDGIIMVDGQFAPMHDKLKAAIAALTPQPIKYLVNTHHHGDHTGGNAAFAADGATVVGHVNESALLASGSTSVTTMQVVAPVSGAALPSQTYSDALTLSVKGRSAALKHPVAAHTAGDTYVWFADANVLSTGDTVVLGRYPTIDYLNGGGINGMIAAAESYLALVNDDTRIVPGHGPLTSKARLAEYHAMLVTTRERMTKLIAEGKSLDDVYAARPFADLDAKVGGAEGPARNYIRALYIGLKG
ncbi:MAG: MBL fold metallo-hydrolase [Proteobacteria bacterium]|nr:MBL fold metallo-hydrolase [Pseudomonadota bacterium]